MHVLLLLFFVLQHEQTTRRHNCSFKKTHNVRARTKTAIREAPLQCSIVTWALLSRSFYCEPNLSSHSTAHLVPMPSMDSVHQCKCNLIAIPTQLMWTRHCNHEDSEYCCVSLLPMWVKRSVSPTKACFNSASMCWKRKSNVHFATEFENHQQHIDLRWYPSVDSVK